MDARTLTALQASIEHWKQVSEANHPCSMSLGPGECALCGLFNSDTSYDICVGCPVYENTGEDMCEATPYMTAFRARTAWLASPASEILRDKFRKAAQAEVSYLQGLLPDEEPTKTYPSTVRLSPDEKTYICDQCDRTWAPGTTSGCPECLAAWKEMDD